MFLNRERKTKQKQNNNNATGWNGTRCESAVCQLDCGHGGVPNPSCTECTGCSGAWRGGVDAGSELNASAISLPGYVAIAEYLCELGVVVTYSDVMPTTDTQCSLAFQNVFFTANCDWGIPVDQYASEEKLADRRYIPRSGAITPSSPPPGYKYWNTPFCADPNSTTKIFVTKQVRTAITFLSPDPLAWKACSNYYDDSVPLSELEPRLDAVIADANAAWQDLQAIKPLQGGLGFGVQGQTGALTSLPLLWLTYTDRTWQGYKIQFKDRSEQLFLFLFFFVGLFLKSIGITIPIKLR